METKTKISEEQFNAERKSLLKRLFAELSEQGFHKDLRGKIARNTIEIGLPNP